MNATAADTATRLALERTRVAYERTMMAWVRTGTSLITFGLLALLLGTVEHVRDLRSLREHHPQMPGSLSRWVAVVMVLLGVVALAAVVTHA